MQTITISTPSEKLVVAQNGTASKKRPPQSSSEVDKLLKANTTLVVWLIFFTVGGGILALYYARIGYIPEMEWKSALVYLFVGSIVGGVIGLLLTISLYLPGVIWSEIIIYDPSLAFTYTPPNSGVSDAETVRELCIWSIVRCIGWPFLFVLVLSHILLLGGGIVYWLGTAALLTMTFLAMKDRFHSMSAVSNTAVGKTLNQQRSQSEQEQVANDQTTTNLPEAKDPFSRQKIKLSSWFTLSILLNQISMYLIYRLSGSPAELTGFFALTILCAAGVWIAAHVVALRHERNPQQAIVAALVAAGLLLFTADNFSSLSVKLMNHFGIGYYERVNLLVTDHGKTVVDGLGIPKCGDLQLCNVEILSKVGDQYFLRVSDKAYVTLPKSDVVAIRPLHQP